MGISCGYAHICPIFRDPHGDFSNKKIPWAGDSKPGKPGRGDLTAPLLAHDLKALLMGKAQ